MFKRSFSFFRTETVVVQDFQKMNRMNEASPNEDDLSLSNADLTTETSCSPESDICCVCLDQMSQVRYDPCGHLNVCVGCHFKMNPLLIRKTPICPVCRAECFLFSWYSPTAFAQALSKIRTAVFAHQNTTKIYAFCKTVLRLYDTPDRAVEVLKEAIQELVLVEPVLLMPKDNIETLLTQASDKFGTFPNFDRLQKMLVQLCQEPWSVDVSLGGSGVCYYGNFGDPPYNLQQYINMLKENIRSIL